MVASEEAAAAASVTAVAVVEVVVEVEAAWQAGSFPNRYPTDRYPKQSYLVGGFNPFEKYYIVKTGIFPK